MTAKELFATTVALYDQEKIGGGMVAVKNFIAGGQTVFNIMARLLDEDEKRNGNPSAQATEDQGFPRDEQQPGPDGPPAG